MRGRGKRQAQSGSLAPLYPQPILAAPTTTADPEGWYVPPDGNHAYCACFAANVIAQYTRDAGTGTLTPIAGAPTAPANGCYYLTGSSDGKFIYAMSNGSGVARQFSRNLSTGALTNLNPNTINAGTGPVDGKMYVSPSNGAEYLVVATKNSDTTGLMQVFSRNTSTGQLSTTPVSSLTFGAANVRPQGVCIVGNHVYVGSFTTTTIYAFTLDPNSGAISAQASPTVAASAGPCFVCASPDGANVYVSTDAGANVWQYSRDASTGALTPLTPNNVPAGNGPYSICMAPNGLSVYVGNSDGQTISQYARDPGTGLLTAMNPAQVRSDPAIGAIAGSSGPPAIGISPDGKNLYASGKKSSAHSVVTFVIHP